jgi:hypothetical protein
MEFVMSLDIETFIRLVRRAIVNSHEERHWQLYCSVYPHFDKKNFKKFDEFYKRPTEEVSKKSSEDIITHVESILQRAGEQKNGVI